MNWIEGYSAQYYMTILDPATWRDLRTVDILGGTVTRTEDGLLESADVELTEYIGEQFVRIYLSADQNGDGGRAAVFTGLLQTPGVEWDGSRRTYHAECYSVLKPVDDILLPRGWYAETGKAATDILSDLLDVLAPVQVEKTAPALSQYIVAESKETRLSMAEKILNAIGWRLRITGEGVIEVLEAPAEPVARFDTRTNDIIELAVTDTQDLFNCPNVYRAVSKDQTVEIRDEDAIAARGREIWAEDSKAVISTGESLAEYAERQLAKLQTPERTISYNRRFLPGITAGDLVELNLPDQEITGTFRVTKQSIELGYNATISEDVVQI